MAMKTPATQKILVYLLRRDLRLSDNPVFADVARQAAAGNAAFTHLLPIYVFPHNQIEISGLIPNSNDEVATKSSPYPEARSEVAGFWRCGPHRVKFLAESLWDLKESLESKGNGLLLRAGSLADVVREAFEHLGQTNDTAESEPKEGRDVDKTSNDADGSDKDRAEIVGVWMVRDEGIEEKREEREVRRVVQERGKEFRLMNDDKYYIDDKDLPFQDIKELPNVFTSYRKAVEPLREKPRKPLGIPKKLPPFPGQKSIAPQAEPFEMPTNLQELIENLHRPLKSDVGCPSPPQMPDHWEPGHQRVPKGLSAHPFKGGERAGLRRVEHLCGSAAMSNYHDTRNGLLGEDFSTKLSAWLAHGCITARQVHAMMLDFEEGAAFSGEKPPDTDHLEDDLEHRRKRIQGWKGTKGFGKGENKGTAAVRFELLWRDYFHLYTRKFGPKMFHIDGVKGEPSKGWKTLDQAENRHSANSSQAQQIHERFRSGRTGIGLVDASQRELFLTGYTSNRARQNVASFITKHIGLDWRIGAEWYECMLIDYDVGSNWGNWQYVAGVGNDPRQDRVFNPVKQASDYDKYGEYIRTWVTELRDVQVEKDGKIDEANLMGVYQAWKLPEEEKKRLKLQDVDWVEAPMKKIEFTLGRKPRNRDDKGRDRRGGRGGRGRSNRGGGGSSGARGGSGGDGSKHWRGET